MGIRHLFAAVPVAALGLALPSEAPANQIEPSDCNLDFTNVYNAGDQVCVTGDVDSVPPGEICGGGYVFVFQAGTNPFFDISNPQHIPNYITTCLGGGGFIDESVWLPPTIPGQYGLLLDEFPFGGIVGAEDVLNDFAFTVSNAPIVFSVNPALIKADAVRGLEAALALEELASWLGRIDMLGTAAGFGLDFGLPGVLAGLALGLFCDEGDFELVDIPCPTSYNSAVIYIGVKIFKGIAGAQKKHYNGIIADPPDPDFSTVVAAKTEDLGQLGGAPAPGADHPLPNALARLTSLLGLQAAAYQALLPTLEKVQGAQQAGDHLGLVLQSEKLQAHAQLALASGAEIDATLDELEAHLSADGQLGQSADVAGILATLDQGLSDEQRAFLYSYGLSDAQIDAVLSDLAAEPVPAEVSWDALLANGRALVAEMQPSLNDLMQQAEQVRNENLPYALRIRPVATLTGPASASVGTAVALTASATHEDPDAAVVFDWDLDGDGAFDDGTGDSVMFTPTAPGLLMVSVRADDGAAEDFATHLIDVAVSNVPPVITSVTPDDMAPFAAVDEVVAFSAEASDADGDPVTLTWWLDGIEQTSGATFELTMPDEAPHKVSVVASDDDPYSPDATASFTVRAAKWEGQTGEGGSGSGGDGSGANGSGANAGAGAGDDGCGCRLIGGSRGHDAWLAMLLAALLGYRRRRSRPSASR